MKFLGDIEPPQLDEIKTIISETAKKFKYFEVALDKFGFFPNQKKPRVFFINVTAGDKLKSIADMLEEKLQGLGLEKEGKFKSHITLARIKQSKNITSLIKTAENISLKGNFPIKEITLYKSTLTKTGPIYEKVASSSLTV